jgi:hypothetical protein
LSTLPNIAALLATAAHPTMRLLYVRPATQFSGLKLLKRHTHALLNRISLLLDVAIRRLQLTQPAKVLRHSPQNSIQNA